MKVFVSGRIHDQENIQKALSSVKKAGHEILFDWTTRGNLKPYTKNSSQSSQFAKDAMDAISTSDVFICITHPEVAGGSSAELGAAIQSHILTGTPRIYMVGEYNTDVVFYFHPAIQKVKSIEDVLVEVAKGV